VAEEAAPAPAAEEETKAEEKEEKEEKKPFSGGEKKKIGNVFALFNQSQITEFKEVSGYLKLSYF